MSGGEWAEAKQTDERGKKGREKSSDRKYKETSPPHCHTSAVVTSTAKSIADYCLQSLPRTTTDHHQPTTTVAGTIQQKSRRKSSAIVAFPGGGEGEEEVEEGDLNILSHLFYPCTLNLSTATTFSAFPPPPSIQRTERPLN